MKEEIYTIPVNEAVEKNTECLFCELHKKAEDDVMTYMTGSAYMEEDVRAQTDERGFCKDHWQMLYDAGNRLGTALMLSTHIKKTYRDIEFLLKKDSAPAKGLFGRKNVSDNTVGEYIDAVQSDCYMCARIQGRFNSYIRTFFYLWQRESDFRERILKSNGFCTPHFGLLIKEGQKRLKAQDFSDMLHAIAPVYLENMKRVDKDLERFIQKFDYRFKDEPWENAADSPQRGILKAAGFDVGGVLK